MHRPKHSWHTVEIGVIVLLFSAMILRFFWSYFTYDVPLGYDPGIYRYLFFKHAEGFPPFWIGDVEPWSRSHPLGLFIVTTPLIRLGLPVDWLIGWIWNVVPMVLLCTLVWITRTRFDRTVALLTFFLGLVSIPFFDGFIAMYWKTYVALFWVIVTFYLLERRSWWAALTSLMVLLTHHQTSLIFVFCLGTEWLLQLPRHWSNRLFRTMTILAAVLVALAFVVYLPVLKEAIIDHIPALLTLGKASYGGAFPSPIFYLQTYSPILLLGAIGCFWDLQRNRRITVWHTATIFCVLLVLLRFFFYRRFFLLLDFFLLPFAALGLKVLWERAKSTALRVIIVIVLALQIYIAYEVMVRRKPVIDRETLTLVQSLHAFVPDDAIVVGAENLSPVWARGWLNEQLVYGPGLMGLQWTEKQWEDVLYGTDAKRKAHISRLGEKVYFMITPLFYLHYGEYAQPFLDDPCFKKVEGISLLHYTCSLQS